MEPNDVEAIKYVLFMLLHKTSPASENNVIAGTSAFHQSLRINARENSGNEISLNPEKFVTNVLFSDRNDRHLTSSAFQYSF